MENGKVMLWPSQVLGMLQFWKWLFVAQTEILAEKATERSTNMRFLSGGRGGMISKMMLPLFTVNLCVLIA
ncbi:hypothetical protein NL676_037868 [Syzygium grande]|nr:hypothetical protein NL676_037868 [Syzygium grande]